jgi:hypothetical protein
LMPRQCAAHSRRRAPKPRSTWSRPLRPVSALCSAKSRWAEKSNEIVAIPAPLDMLAIEGATVSIDAMGCQRDNAEKIVTRKADYVLALKGNQGSLCEDVELFAAEQKANGGRLNAPRW